MKEVLSQSQLKNLKDHQYSATGQSLIEPWFQVFWRWLIEKVPLTWAPNSITLVGLIINILTTLLLVICSPDGSTEVKNNFNKNAFPVFVMNIFRENLKRLKSTIVKPAVRVLDACSLCYFEKVFDLINCHV